ncbi:MAG: hypothetical protein EOO06_08200 [Chitinophagaceae bacterium]|nr:MAG: hypothetical protein EOO06_08200 [Chitinophagaceae bacterium]
MRSFFFCLAIVYSSTLCAQIEKPKTVANYDLKGNVKSLSETYYDATEKFGVPVKERVSFKGAYAFNKSGFLTESVLQSLVRSKWKETAKLKYDRNNNLIEERLDDEGDISIARIKYNRDGTMSEINTTDKKGRLTSKHIFSYDTSEAVEFLDWLFIFNERRIYNSDGTLKELHKFNSIYYDVYDAKEKRLSSLTTLKDMEGKLTYERSQTDIRTVVYEYKYNNLGQKIESTYQLDKRKPTSTSYEYNEQGLLKKELSSDKIIEFTYTYDSRGNWITRTRKEKYNKTTSYEITERAIKYY